MKKIIVLSAFNLLFSIIVSGQTKPDYSGNWVIDSNRSKQPVAVMTKSVRQTAGEIEILNDSEVIETLTGKKAKGSIYALNDDEQSVEIENATGKFTVVQSAKFDSQGKLKLIRKQKTTAPINSIEPSVMEIWELADEGRTLKIKTALTNSAGEEVFESFFTKSPVSYDDNLNAKVLNGKARQLIKPAYPETAKKAQAQGNVFVQVLIDEKGNVVLAKAIYGHQALLKSSEQAARLCKFSPTKINNTPVKISGVIVYNFTKI